MKDLSAINIPIHCQQPARLQRVLDHVQGKATARVLTVELLINYAEEAEKMLNYYDLPQRLRPGAIYSLGPILMPYRSDHRSACTVCRLRRNSQGWVLDSLSRREFFPVPGGRNRTEAIEPAKPALDYIIQNSVVAPRVRELIADAYNRGSQANTVKPVA